MICPLCINLLDYMLVVFDSVINSSGVTFRLLIHILPCLHLMHLRHSHSEWSILLFICIKFNLAVHLLTPKLLISEARWTSMGLLTKACQREMERGSECCSDLLRAKPLLEDA